MNSDSWRFTAGCRAMCLATNPGFQRLDCGGFSMEQTIRQIPALEPNVQHLLNALPFYVLLVDSEHCIVAANNAVKQDLGLAPEQLIGAYCPTAIHGCNEPIEKCPLAEALEKGQAAEREVFDSRSARWLRAGIYPTPLVTGGGRPIYLHFARDITELKKTESELSRSLEHHRALCNLLLKFQNCRNGTQILEVLINQLISLSWLGMTTTAAGFLVTGQSLDLMAQCNIAPAQLQRCRHLEFGECLCGKVAETGYSLICPSTSSSHTIGYEGMRDHQHAVFPIRHEGKVLGVLTLYLDPGDNLDDFRIRFLEAAVAATAAALAGQLAKEELKHTKERCMAQLISSQEDERKHVARNLHDHVCQSLSALLLEIQLHTAEDERLKHISIGCENRIRGLIDEVRQIAGQLRPTILDDYGLESALSSLLKELTTNTKLAIDYQFVSSSEQNERLPASVEVSLFRVAVEALNNVLSHAAASQVSVIILWQRGGVILLVEDDGRGFNYPAIRRNIDRCPGLIGMEERLALIGGALSIESIPHKGTTVRAEIPLKHSIVAKGSAMSC
jgi:PAS domain S-box-containing protein